MGYAAILILGAQIATGQPGAAEPVVDRLASCRTIEQEAGRLACYDRAVVELLDARQRQDIVVLDRGEVRKAKQSLFGFSLPSIKLFNGAQDREPMKQITGRLLSTTSLPGGRLRFKLDQGGVWETTEQSMVPPRVGDIVTIKAGSLGAYIATAPGRRSSRVQRIN